MSHQRTNATMLLRHGALAVFAGTAALMVWYHHRERKDAQKKKNAAKGSNQELDGQVISAVAAAQYGLEPTLKCEPIRGGSGGFKQDYSVETAQGEKYVLRVYLNDKYYIRDSNDVRFELELLHYLRKEKGLPVIKALKATSGDWLSVVEFNEEGELLLKGSDNEEENEEDDEIPTNCFSRHAALFELAKGTQVTQLNRQSKGKFMGPNQFHALGILMAQLHKAADTFPNPQKHHRCRWDTDTYLLDASLQQLVTWGMAGQLDFFRSTARTIRERIGELPKTTPYYGIIHGDLHSSNLYCNLEEKQFTVVDWDHCGYGWRVYEFAWLSRVLPTASFSALVRGYESVRKLIPLERELLPIFAMLRDIWDMGDVLALAPLGVNDRPTRARIHRYVEHLKQTKKKVDQVEAARKERASATPTASLEQPAQAQAPDANAPATVPAQREEEDEEDSDDSSEDDEGFGPAGVPAPAPAPRPNPLSG